MTRGVLADIQALIGSAVEIEPDAQPARGVKSTRGRKPKGEIAMPAKERMKAKRERDGQGPRKIAILDMETDPFDENHIEGVRPFLAVLYWRDADPVTIWEESEPEFVAKVVAAIEALPGRFVIYAHNGGKFDFMFLLRRIRGQIAFKGRGIMSANIGRHELRDSFHIIPERLANWQKDTFDYNKLRRGVRSKYREEIVRYCINDCKYLLEIVEKFTADYGLKISIGQAAIAKLRESYHVERLGAQQDAFLRNYFFGGRVECIAGKGLFCSDELPNRAGYKLFDVNSMYPFVMATYDHPTSASFAVRRGLPNGSTVFLELECDNYGALVRRGEDGEISAEFPNGKFRTTIWEYETALKYNLIENVRINWCIDFSTRSNFSDFILPLYDKRQDTKRALKTLTPGSAAYNDMKKDDIFYKLILNNAYGKFAQNPRKFKECFITEPNEEPPCDCHGCEHKHSLENGFHTGPREYRCKGEGKCFHCENGVPAVNGMHVTLKTYRCRAWDAMPKHRAPDYWIWERPQQHLRFNNVATAASITGAARAVLMEAIALADDPIYCDTDSLICRGLPGLDLDNVRLGAWKLEHEIDEAIIAGKKLYACKLAGFPDGHKDRIKIRSKGVSGLTWRDLERILDGELIDAFNPGATITKTGQQYYLRRKVRATVNVKRRRVIQERRRKQGA